MSGQQYQPYNSLPSPGKDSSSKPNSFKKGLGFFPSSMVRSVKDPMFDMLKTPPPLTAKDLIPSRDDASSGYSIPLFHLDQIAQASGKERRGKIQTLGIALTQVGLVALETHRFLPLLERVNNEMRWYFHQPIEQKILDWKGKKCDIGFSIHGQEVSSPQKAKIDIKETYSIPQNFNQWPRKCPSFSRVMMEYHDFLCRYSMEIMKYLLEYLGQPTDTMEENLSKTDNTLHLTCYPSFKNLNDPQATWTSSHIDQSAMTLISPGTIPGLQLRTNQGHWVPVNTPDEVLILMIGSQIELKTAGLIKARRHRVVNPGGQYSRMERFDSQHSVSWNDPQSLKPFNNCLELITKGMTRSKKAAYLKKYI